MGRWSEVNNIDGVAENNSDIFVDDVQNIE